MPPPVRTAAATTSRGPAKTRDIKRSTNVFLRPVFPNKLPQVSLAGFGFMGLGVLGIVDTVRSAMKTQEQGEPFSVWNFLVRPAMWIITSVAGFTFTKPPKDLFLTDLFNNAAEGLLKKWRENIGKNKAFIEAGVKTGRGSFRHNVSNELNSILDKAIDTDMGQALKDFLTQSRNGEDPETNIPEELNDDEQRAQFKELLLSDRGKGLALLYNNHGNEMREIMRELFVGKDGKPPTASQELNALRENFDNVLERFSSLRLTKVHYDSRRDCFDLQICDSTAYISKDQEGPTQSLLGGIVSLHPMHFVDITHLLSNGFKQIEDYLSTQEKRNLDQISEEKTEDLTKLLIKAMWDDIFKPLERRGLIRPAKVEYNKNAKTYQFITKDVPASFTEFFTQHGIAASEARNWLLPLLANDMLGEQLSMQDTFGDSPKPQNSERNRREPVTAGAGQGDDFLDDDTRDMLNRLGVDNKDDKAGKDGLTYQQKLAIQQAKERLQKFKEHGESLGLRIRDQENTPLSKLKLALIMLQDHKHIGERAQLGQKKYELKGMLKRELAAKLIGKERFKQVKEGVKAKVADELRKSNKILSRDEMIALLQTRIQEAKEELVSQKLEELQGEIVFLSDTKADKLAENSANKKSYSRELEKHRANIDEKVEAILLEKERTADPEIARERKKLTTEFSKQSKITKIMKEYGIAKKVETKLSKRGWVEVDRDKSSGKDIERERLTTKLVNKAIAQEVEAELNKIKEGKVKKELTTKYTDEVIAHQVQEKLDKGEWKDTYSSEAEARTAFTAQIKDDKRAIHNIETTINGRVIDECKQIMHEASKSKDQERAQLQTELEGKLLKAMKPKEAQRLLRAFNEEGYIKAPGNQGTIYFPEAYKDRIDEVTLNKNTTEAIQQETDQSLKYTLESVRRLLPKLRNDDSNPDDPDGLYRDANLEEALGVEKCTEIVKSHGLKSFLMLALEGAVDPAQTKLGIHADKIHVRENGEDTVLDTDYKLFLRLALSANKQTPKAAMDHLEILFKALEPAQANVLRKEAVKLKEQADRDIAGRDRFIESMNPKKNPQPNPNGRKEAGAGAK